MLSDYLALKTESLRAEIARFEEKWQMDFAEFSQRFGEGTLPVDSYSYDTEHEFWGWEQAETLLQHYEALQP